jgi:HD-GYP domain-containing protein (c-di-GMP phosphodiesterase class II)
LSLTLLVESNTKIEGFYKLNLATWLGLQTVSTRKAELALKILSSNSSPVTLIIARYKTDKEETAKLLIDFIKAQGLNIPVIVIGPGQDIPGASGHVSNSLDIKLLIKSCALALNITAKEMSQKTVPDFYPVAISYFSSLKRSVCTVYSQDPSAPGSYLPQFEKQKEINPNEIKQIIDSGVQFLYVDKLDRLEFVSSITSELISTLQDEHLSPDEQITAGDTSIELLSKKLLSIGITDETINLAKKNIDRMRKQAKQSPQLSKLINRLLNNKASYLYQHTQILTYVALHIVKNIDWGTPEQEDKISFISFFHDIVLENDDQAKIKSNLELRNSSLTPPQKQLVEKHAQMAAEFVVKFPHAPMGADQIIRQHHGTLNGVGFSEHYGANISPMAVVFIIAEEFTRIIMQRVQGPFDRNEMLRELKEEFPTKRFEKTLDLLQTITF